MLANNVHSKLLVKLILPSKEVWWFGENLTFLEHIRCSITCLANNKDRRKLRCLKAANAQNYRNLKAANV